MYKGTLIAVKNMDESKKFHEPLEHSWGQRAVRFYGPDHHIIEVAEDIVMVVKRFCNSGLSEEEVAVRMDVPVDYVKECIKS